MKEASYSKPFSDEEVREIKKAVEEVRTTQATPKPFPYWPPQPSEEEMKRMELMMELNKWANNDDDLAKRAAETLVLLLVKQFKLDLQSV